VLQHVHVNRFYFCKIFKKTSGMTLIEYVTWFRLEKAETLVVAPPVRISEVVFAAGSGSIPQFNSAFRCMHRNAAGMSVLTAQTCVN